MAELYQMTIRAFFQKKNRAKYISHLDLMRCISRALKRSRLPVWHTLGFNPHIYTTFALPLALGYESECESVDFRLTEMLPMQEVTRRLDDALPPDIHVYRTQPVRLKPEAICWADYELALEFDRQSAEQGLAAFQSWCARPEILVVKKTKKGERTMDVKHHFSVWNLRADAARLCMTMRTAAGISLNINPTLILDTFAAQSGFGPDAVSVLRTAVLTGELEDFS